MFLLTTTLSGKIEELSTRRLQSKIGHFLHSSTDTVRKMLFEQSPSAPFSAHQPDGGGAPMKRGG